MKANVGTRLFMIIKTEIKLSDNYFKLLMTFTIRPPSAKVIQYSKELQTATGTPTFKQDKHRNLNVHSSHSFEQDN